MASGRTVTFGPATVKSLSRAAVGAVDLVLDRLLAECAHTWSHLPFAADLLADLHRILSAPAKRLRPALVFWGHTGATGFARPSPEVGQLGAAVELLHTFAIIHDDVMDGSPMRRGTPTMHVRSFDRHLHNDWRGDRRRYAEGTAILAGDLAFSLSNGLIANLPGRVREIWQVMCQELVVGQHLDMTGAAAAVRDAAYAAEMARLKSGRYTVVRPLQLGAALAGDQAFAACQEVYGEYGEPLGLAFQWRDDLIGVIGNPAETGKPRGEDLRDGKPTLLLSLVHERAPASATALLDKVGRPDLNDDDVEALIELCGTTGALTTVEQRIDDAVARAQRVAETAPLDDRTRFALADIAAAAGWRRS